MKKSAVAIATIIAMNLTAMAADDNKIPAVGVLAHTVLSQAEIAKLKNFEINKAIEIERAKSVLKSATSKLKSINLSSEDKLKTTQDSNEAPRVKIQKSYAVSDLLSDGILWAEEVIVITDKFKYINDINAERDALSTQLENSKMLKISAESNISRFSIQAQRDKQIEIDSNTLENKKLLEAKESELKALIESKLLLGDFEINLYYLTAENKPQKEDIDLINKIFKSASNIENVNIKITGRADPRGDIKYNEKLAKERSLFIKKLATKAGIRQENIQSNSFVSKGEIHKNRELHFFDRNTTVTIYKK